MQMLMRHGVEPLSPTAAGAVSGGFKSYLFVAETLAFEDVD